MPGGKFPLSVAEKHKLFSATPVPKGDLKKWGDVYRERGLLHDALEFYRGADDEAAIRALSDSAVEEADLVLLVNVWASFKAPVPADALGRLQERAATLGKETVAQRASLLLVPSR
jgi:hypothetical protein